MRQEWDKAFAPSLTKANKKKIYMNEYLWHVFSYEKVSCLKEEKAQRQFDNQKKKGCYIFFQHSDDVFFIERASKL